MDDRLRKQMEFALEIDKEKNVFRQTHLSGKDRNENDAEHAWHMAIMAYLLKAEATERLEVAIPDEYFAFLKVVNGIEYNGCIIYGIDEEFLEDDPEQEISGFIENNEGYRMDIADEGDNYTIIGESDMSWYAYNGDDGKYYILDSDDGDVMEEVESFDALIEAILKESLQ